MPGFLFIVGEPQLLKVTIRQNRVQEKFPNLETMSFSEWPHSLEKYIADNLGLRKWFIANQMRFFEWYLRTPIIYALRGKDHGLYSLVLIKRHITPISQEKERLCRLRALWTGRQAYLKAHGIAYLLVMPPDKESVLMQDIAWWFPILNKEHGFTYKVQHMLSQSNINYMMFDSLFAYSEEPASLFYQKKDLFHWSCKGFLWANRAIEQKLSSLLPEKSFKNTPSAQETVTIHATPPYGTEAVASYYYDLPPENFTVEPYRFEGANLHLDKMFATGRYPTGMKITNHLPDVNGSMVIARDSFFGQDFTFMAGNATIGPFPPWACNFKTIYTIDRAEFSLTTLENIIKIKPLIVIDAHCERTLWNSDIREIHIFTMLLGEKFLGNLKFIIDPNTSIELLRPYGKVKIEQCSDNKGESCLIFKSEEEAFIDLPAIHTDGMGYAVIAARIKPADGNSPRCQFRAVGGEWTEVPNYSKSIVNPEILYAQIFSHPNAKLDIRILLPGKGSYEVLPLELPAVTEKE